MKFLLFSSLLVVFVHSQTYQIAYDTTKLIDEADPKFEFSVTRTGAACIDTGTGCLNNPPQFSFTLSACSDATGKVKASIFDVKFVTLLCTPTYTPAVGATPATYTCDMRDNVLNDNLVETNECFDVVYAAGGGNTYSNNIGTLEIDGSEPGATIKLVAKTGADSIAETAGKIEYDVSLSHVNALPLVVDIAYTDVTAQSYVGAGAEYFDYDSKAETTKTFAQDTAVGVSQLVSIPIRPDNIQELSESFTVRVASRAGSLLVYNQGVKVVTITDANTLTYAFSKTRGREGSTNPVQVTLSSPIQMPGTFTMTIEATNNGNAKTEDYTLVPTANIVSCTEAMGSKCADKAILDFPFTITDDELLEGDETFSVKIIRVAVTDTAATAIVGTTGAVKKFSDANPNGAVVTIADNEAATVYILGKPSVDEAVNANLEFTVKVSHTPEYKLSFATEGVVNNCDTAPCLPGQADTKTDIGTLSHLVNVAANSREAKFQVSITNDDVQEGLETFTVVLKVPQPAGLVTIAQKKHPGQNIGTIKDNELPTVVVEDAVLKLPVTEAVNGALSVSTALDFKVTLSHAYDTEVQFAFTPVNTANNKGVAEYGKDWFHQGVCGPNAPVFVAPPGAGVTNPCLGTLAAATLPDGKIAPGQKEGKGRVFVINDHIEEGDETFQIKLEAPVVNTVQYDPCYNDCYKSPAVTKNTGTGTVSELVRGEMTQVSIHWGDLGGQTGTVSEKYPGSKITFTVKLTHQVDTDVVINFETVGGTATPDTKIAPGSDNTADYVYAKGTVKFDASTQPGPANFPAFSNEQTFQVEIKDDILVESIESFSVEISVSEKTRFETVWVDPARGKATVEITSDDVGTVSVADGSGEESTGTVDFLVTLSHLVEGRTDVSFKTTQVAGIAGLAKMNPTRFTTAAAAEAQAKKCSAGSNKDFVEASAANTNTDAMIPPFAKVGQFSVELVNDNCQERDETFSVEITAAAPIGSSTNILITATGSTTAAVTITTDATKSTAVGTILDDEGTTISIKEALTLSEDDSSLRRLTVELSHQVDFPVSAGFKFESAPAAVLGSGGATVLCADPTDLTCSADFTVVSPRPQFGEADGTGVVEFQPLSVDAAMIIRVKDDSIVEPRVETASLKFSASSFSIKGGYPTAKDSFTLQITDNDDSKLSIEPSSADEKIGASASFRVALSNRVQTDVNFEWSTSTTVCDQCAKAGIDFTGQPKIVGKIDSMESGADLSVALVNDNIQECDETFKVNLVSLAGPAGLASPVGDWNKWGKTNGLELGVTSADITIKDDEELSIKNLEVSAKEAALTLTWNLELSHMISVDAELKYDTSDENYRFSYGRAKKNDRYVHVTNQALGFGTSGKAAVIQPAVKMINDQKVSPDQSFSVILSKPTLGCAADLFKKALPTLTGTVQDDEAATLYLQANQEIPETGDKVLDVKLSHPVGAWPENLKYHWKVNAPTENVVGAFWGTQATFSDFGATTRSVIPLNFKADQSQKVTVSIKADQLTELKKEYFNLNFEPFFNTGLPMEDYRVFDNVVTPILAFPQMVAIASTDTSTLTVTPATNFLENDAMYKFNVVLSKGTEEPFEAQVSCTAVGDQSPAPQTLKFRGETGETKEVELAFPANDFVVENSKTFAGLPCKLEIVTPIQYKGVITIPASSANFNAKVDDDDRAFLSVEPASNDEGKDITFTATLSTTVDTDVSVEYYTEVGGTNTAKADDIVEIKSTAVKTFTIKKGDTTKKFTVSTKTDKLLEGDQYFTAVLQNLVADDRRVKILTKRVRGTVKDINTGKISIAKVGDVDEGETMKFKVTLTEKTEDDLEFSYTAIGGQMDRTMSGSKTSDAVACVDYAIPTHCKGLKLNPATLKKNPLTATIQAGKTTGTVEIKTLKDGEVDYTNVLEIKLKQIVSSKGEVTIDATKKSAKSEIKDLDSTVWSLGGPKPNKVKECKPSNPKACEKINVEVALTKPYRRMREFKLSTESNTLIKDLDYPSIDKKKFTIEGGSKSKTYKWTVPDNNEVIPEEEPFQFILFEGKKNAEKDRKTWIRVDVSKACIELDLAGSVLTNIEGGSGLKVAYKLVETVRTSDNIVVNTGTYPLGGTNTETSITFKSKKIKGVDRVASSSLLLFFDVTGKVTLSKKDIELDKRYKKCVKGFPATLKLRKVDPKPVFIPSLCQLPIRASPIAKSNSKDVYVHLTSGETNTFYPGTCWYYPDGTTTAVWNNEFKATAGGPKVKIENPDDDSMFVNVKINQQKKRKVVDLSSQGETPYVIQLYEQIDLDIVVADKLFLYECNKNGRQCCNTIRGENLVTKCKVNQKKFRSKDSDPVWSGGYDYDVSGVVHVGITAKETGLHRQCFGFSPVDGLYPDGFCLTFYVPEAPIIQTIGKQALVQATSLEIPLDIMSGTWYDREKPYACEVHCVKGCTTASAKLNFDKAEKTWSLFFTASSVNIGDAQFAVVVKDRYHTVLSQAVHTRTVYPAIGNAKC